MAYKHWGEIIQELAQHHGASNRKLAMDTGINRGTVVKIMRGSQCLQTEHLETLLEYLGYRLEAVQRQE